MNKNKEVEKIALKIKDCLLKSVAKKYIMKIILFGSWAKGISYPNSDIDVLIVKRNGKKAEDYINNAVYDIMIDTGLPLETLICSVEDILWIDNYFIYNILSYGKEVFSMDKDALKEEAIDGLLELSKEYLTSAEDAAKGKHWRVAIDAIYNSLELIVKALLLKKIDDLPGSHGGIVGKFGEIFVRSNEVDSAIGRGLNNALRLRNWARYKWETKITKDEYEKVYNLFKKLNEFAQKILKQD